ncbi:MAG: glycosyltransferase family 9 protein [Chloroflexota bacterium]
MTIEAGMTGPLDGARRILAVRLDAMGDVLMTTPALRALRRGAPDAHLALLTSPAGASVAGLLPELDETIVYEAPWMKATPAGRDPRLDRAFIRDLAARRFDAAIIFTVHSQDPLPAALTCYLAGIPRRIAHTQVKGYQLLTDPVADREVALPTRHEVRRQLDLVEAFGFVPDDDHLSVRVPPEASHRMRRWAARRALLDGGPWAVLHPGASAPSRRYPPERFAAAADRLALEAGWRIVLAGGPSDVSLLGAIERSMRAAAIRGPVDASVADLAALLSIAPVLIGCNSGPAHLAAAVGTPVVVAYALTNRQHTPWGVPSRVLTHDVPCRDCGKSICPMGHHACMQGIDPDEIVTAALELVPGTGRRARRAPLAVVERIAG